MERTAGAETCPDARALGEAVATRLGYDPFVHEGPARDLVLRVRFGRADGRLTGTVAAFDPAGAPKGEKTIVSGRGDCGELAEATTVTIAILLDPRTGLVRPTPETKPEPNPLAPEKPPPPPPRAPAPARGPAVVPRLRVGGVGSVGALPEPSLAARAAVGLEARRWGVDLELRADLPRDATSGDQHVTTGLLLGALVPCLRRGIVEGCAVVAAGALRSSADRGSPANETSFHLAVGPRLAVVVPLSDVLALQLHGDALMAVTRTTLHVDGAAVWTTPLVSGLLGAAVEVRFP